MSEVCPACGRPYTSRQKWWQANRVPYYAFLHEDDDACRVHADEVEAEA